MVFSLLNSIECIAVVPWFQSFSVASGHGASSASLVPVSGRGLPLPALSEQARRKEASLDTTGCWPVLQEVILADNQMAIYVL
jgi:hypothetical protein